MKTTVLTVAAPLQCDVECFRVFEYQSTEAVAIKVAPKALPGIVFQHDKGRSALENIVTPTHIAETPTLFLYGAVVEPSVMNYKAGSYTGIQVILKPQALQSLFGLNAMALACGAIDLNELAADDLNLRLMEAQSTPEQIALLTDFLLEKLHRARDRDALVEASLQQIHKNPAEVSVRDLLQQFNISERHFERRFSQAVGVTPQSYIRVCRFNQAIRLLKTAEFGRLTDVAHSLCYYDQSHFIRDIKALSGITPKDITQLSGDSYHDQLGYSYV